MPVFAANNTTLTELQIEFLKSLKYVASEKQIADIKSLLRHYFAQQLDHAIEKTESERNYTAEIYESWLKTNTTTPKSKEA